MTEPAANFPTSTTVYLTNDGLVEGGVRRIVADWCAGGLVDGSLWVSADAWAAAGGHLEEVKADVVNTDGVAADFLLDVLGLVRFDALRVVVVNVATRERPGDPGLTQLAEAFARALRSHLPEQTPLRVINIIVPASGVAGVPRSVLLETQHASAVNVVVSPEDRITDEHISVGVRPGDGGNLEGHAALAAVTAGALWRGMEGAPFDEQRNPSLGGEHLLVSRTFASAVQVEPLIDSVSQRALQPREDWPTPDSDDVNPPIPALDGARLAARALEKCGELADGALQYDRYQPPPPPALRTIGLLHAFGELFRFLYRRLRRLPREVGLRIRTAAVERAERLSQSMTYGHDSTVAVKVGARGVGDPLSMESVVSEAHQVLEVTGALQETYNPPTPELWRALRGLVFGLIDGSDLPEDFEVLIAGDLRQVITRPDRLVPNPFDAAQPALVVAIAKALGVATVTLPAGDPWAARRIRAALEARLAELRQPSESGEEPDKKRAAQASKVESVLEGLTGWIDRQSSTLLWQVGERLAAQIETAQYDLQDAMRQLTSLEEDGQPALLAAWRRCRRRWIAISVVAALMITGAWHTALTARQAWGSTAGTTALAFFLILWSFVSYLRTEFRVLHRAERKRFQISVAYETALRSAQELVRLGALYSQLVDWVEITAAVVRRPWGVPPGSVTQPNSPAHTALPKALGLAGGETDDEQRSALASGASHKLFVKGWLLDAYEQFSTEAVERFAVLRALRAIPDPDSDTPQAPTFVRAHLRQEITNPDYGRSAFGRGRAQVAEFLRDQPPARLVTSVVRSGDETEDLSMQPEQFFSRILPSINGSYLVAESWTDGAVTAREHQV
jgi:hypothetical protein